MCFGEEDASALYTAIANGYFDAEDAVGEDAEGEEEWSKEDEDDEGEEDSDEEGRDMPEIYPRYARDIDEI